MTRFGVASVKSVSEGRTGLGTMKKSKMPLVKRQASVHDRRIIVEEEEQTATASRPLELSIRRSDSVASTDTEGSTRPPTPATPTPLTPPEAG